MDVMPVWTLDQIAGLVFGGVLLAFWAAAPQVDTWVATRQRRQLGLCERCGGVNEPGSCAEAACPMRAAGGGGQGGGGQGGSG
ncbi:MAG: hypothetical protein J3K34DRAFT_467850 [Monoraphidium minutum]|nr:MAG: hypothetical protein J3K34DRAFT_467850 [Monoraphidium minutum]